MEATVTPRIRLTRPEPGEDTCQSLLISLLRGLCAIQVAAAHLRAEFFPSLRTLADPSLAYQGLAFLTGFAHQAVVLFFLISGWLVGGSLMAKLGQPQALQSYAIDRLSRLWTVLIPTFVLMLLFGVLAGQLLPNTIDYSPSNSYSLLSFAGNLVGLQTVTMEPFGGNFPLWSLANETWYYLMFPLLLVLVTAATAARRALAMLSLVAVALTLPYDITLYFLLWLLGAVGSRVRVACSQLMRWVVLAVFCALAAYFRLTGFNDDLNAASFPQDLVYSLVFLLFLCSMDVKADPGSRRLAQLRSGATFFAEFSFTLYVFHIPLIRLMQHVGLTVWGRYRLSPDNWIDYGIYASLLGVILVLSYGSYLLFEAHTPKVRRWLKELLLSAPAVPAAAKH